MITLHDCEYLYARIADMELVLSVKAQDGGLIFDLINTYDEIVWTSSLHIGDIDVESEK